MSKIVKRTLDFIELFAEERRPLSLSEISRLLDIPMSSSFDVVRSLQERGYLYELGQRAGYYPTQRIVRLAAIISENDPILMRADIMLRALRDEFDETVSLSQSTGRQGKYLLVYEASHPLRYTARVGDSLRSLHATSIGKGVLATLSPEDLDEVLSQPLQPLTEHTLTDPEKLRANVAEGAKRGLFINREESAQAIITLTSPFRWNRADYFVTMAGPLYRLEPRLDEIEQRLKQICRDLEMPDTK
ncbi:transcriptional regulator [Nitratireductor aestuarii]|uniref:Transcriptional regulator n=1 Tax=Nitratireductor aestuarii TaxID=1735103 RepID=A0A916RYG6_9HYPH|nr:IclR family transcriptional regulator [Nitratireductor aestuarii]GGA76821.1 transcriptional regulator [Nitratireductor aestuarii]